MLVTITKEMWLFIPVVYFGTILFDVFCFKWLEKQNRLKTVYFGTVVFCAFVVPVADMLSAITADPILNDCLLYKILVYLIIFGQSSLGAIITVTYFQERRGRKNTI